MGYQIQGDQFGAVRNEEFIALGKDIRIISCSRDVDTNEFYIKVEFLVGNNVVSKEVKMDSNLINQLEDSGYLANRRNEASLKDYIDQQLKELTNEAKQNQRTEAEEVRISHGRTTEQGAEYSPGIRHVRENPGMSAIYKEHSRTGNCVQGQCGCHSESDSRFLYA